MKLLTYFKKNIALKKENDRLRVKNLMLRLEIEELVQHPVSERAQIIIAKYRKLKAIRDEQELELKN